MMNEVLLAARGLTRWFGRRQALHGIDLDLRRGEVLGFLGLNGAGKSTTMQILCGALAPHAGTVEICGHALSTAPRAAKRLLGYLPEEPPLYADMLVDEYLATAAHLRLVPPGHIADAVQRARALCGLGDVGGRLIAHLSKGYQQRVGIAQAIVHSPPVLLLDEPTSGLDPLQIRDVRELIRTLGRDCAIILSTHILPEAQALAQRIVILHEGRIVHDQAQSTLRGLRVRFVQAEVNSVARALATLSEVASARQQGDAWLLETPAPDTLAPALAALAHQHGWGLRELTPDYDALEARFARLTAGAEAA